MTARAPRLLLALAAAGVVAASAVTPFAAAPARAGAGVAATAATCAAGMMPEVDALSSAGAAPHCVPAVHPESFADLARRDGALAARRTGPFRDAAPGAMAAAVLQARSLAPAGTMPGSGGQWAPLGKTPYRADDPNYPNVVPLGFKTLSGRITSFAYDPAVAGRFWAAPAAGGVFETTDAGNLWHSIGDGLPTQQMGALAYSPVTRRLYAGTGDNAFGGSSYAGLGLFYSDNDGSTWVRANGVPDNSLTFRVVVSGADSTGMTVYAATSRGLFRSDDGGANFSNVNLPTSPTGYTVLDQNPKSPTHGQYVDCKGRTDVPLCFFASIVTDVVVKSTTSANAPAGAVIAAVGWRAGSRQDTDASGNPVMLCKSGSTATACLQAPQNGIYTSTTGQPGSFTFQSHAAPPVGTSVSPLSFAPDNIVGRTALGIAQGTGQNNDAVYALVQDASKFQGCVDDPLDGGAVLACNATVQGLGLATVVDGAYASYDFGNSWTKIMNYTQLRTGANTALAAQNGYSPGIQGWYNLWIEPDPVNTDPTSKNPVRVAFGLEEIWENNVPADPQSTILTLPWTAQAARVGAASPWVVIGRYWDGCTLVAVQLTGIGCSPSLQASPSQGTTTHPDQHAHAFIPDGHGGVSLLAGSDGGAWIQHIAGGADFSNDNWGNGINAGLNTLQPYDVSIARDGTVVGGLQDNGEDKITPDGAQREVFGGDGFYSTIDPTNSRNILEEYTYAATAWSNDGGATWTRGTPTGCSSSTALFGTPIEQDPTKPGHVLVGCSQLQESTSAYSGSFAMNFDLTTAPSGATRIPSALAVRQENEYAGWCGYCDIVTGKIPFDSGIVTNVGGSAPGAIGSSAGWHDAAALCPGCGTANGKLPKRYITSIQEDPSNARTVYVTLGGYGRRWIPPGSLGDDVSNVGVGHVFKSVNAGHDFVDISGDLPDAPANWTMLHDGHLVVATDLGVFESSDSTGGHYGILGAGLPHTPVFVIRPDPSNPNRMVAATYGRGFYQYTFADAVAPGPSPSPTPAPLPNTSGAAADLLPFAGLFVLLVGGLFTVLLVALFGRRRTSGAT